MAELTILETQEFALPLGNVQVSPTIAAEVKTIRFDESGDFPRIYNHGTATYYRRSAGQGSALYESESGRIIRLERQSAVA